MLSLYIYKDLFEGSEHEVVFRFGQVVGEMRGAGEAAHHFLRVEGQIEDRPSDYVAEDQGL